MNAGKSLLLHFKNYLPEYCVTFS